MMVRSMKLLAALAVMIGLLSMPALAAGLSGAGGTAIYPVLSKWAEQYKNETGTAVNYQAIGSGGGIAQIKAKTVDFANSDKPLTPDDLKTAGLAQFPAVIISITPVVNLAGIKPGQLVLDGATLADIYLGKITDWDSAAIQQLNPGLTLPHTKISVVYRSDGSGTTFNFTDYLSKMSPEWKQKVGSDTSVSFPVGVGGKGNAGVAQYVNQIKGAIGYVEYAYVQENKMTYTRMVNAAGATVEPSFATFSNAAANADFSKVQDFYLILTNQPGKDSWPIIAATYMLMRKDYPAAQNAEVLKFLDWCLKKGSEQAKALAYVPLPDSVVKQVETAWSRELVGPDGKPAWQGN